jgi:hypothetical protein
LPRNTTAALKRTRDQAAAAPKPFNTGTTSVAEKGRITVDLGPGLYRDLKRSATWHERKMNDIVRELVAGWVKDHPTTSAM